MKIIINKCYGGYSWSREACLWLREHGLQEAIDFPLFWGEKWSDGTIYEKRYEGEKERDSIHFYDTERTDPLLIECLETLGSKACSSWASKLEIVEIPDDLNYTIEEYDGIEWIAETHRTWG